jgi:hypothetical protein
MIVNKLIINRKNLFKLAELTELIKKCASPAAATSSNYAVITAILLTNVEQFNIDEDVMNISRFAVGLATEISPHLLKQAKLFHNDHWEWRPVILKLDGKNHRTSDVRPSSKQAACMIDVLAYQLKNDPEFRDGIKKLEDWQIENELWGVDDYSHLEY